MIAEIEQARVIALPEGVECRDFGLERLFGEKFRVGFDGLAVDAAFARVVV